VQWNPQKRRPPDRLPTTPVLRVEMQGGEIVVTASNIDYVVTYHKPANSPQLLAKSYPRKEDRRVSMTLAQFLTDACGRTPPSSVTLDTQSTHHPQPSPLAVDEFNTGLL
jgi:hypothetical protein